MTAVSVRIDIDSRAMKFPLARPPELEGAISAEDYLECVRLLNRVGREHRPRVQRGMSCVILVPLALFAMVVIAMLIDMRGVTAVAEHSVWPVFIAIAFVASPFVGLFVSNRAFGKMRAAMEAQVERINASGRFDVEFNIDAEVAQPDGAGAGARRRAARTLRLRIYPRQFVTGGRAPVAVDTRGGAQPEIAYAPNHPALRHSTSRVNPVVAHCAVDPYAGGDDAALPSARRDSRAPRRSSFLERLRHSMAPRPSLVQASGADGLELAGDAAAPPSLRQPGELGRAPGNARASAFSLAPRADSRTGPPTPGGGAAAAV